MYLMMLHVCGEVIASLKNMSADFAKFNNIATFAKF